MTISFKISENTKEKAIEYFKDKKRDKTPAYAIFQADEEDTVVKLYESGSMVFQGISADIINIHTIKLPSIINIFVNVILFLSA